MAAADAYRAIRNAPYRATFALRNTAGQVVSGATPAGQVSVDSAAFGAVAATPTEIGSSGVYYLDFTATELTATSNAAYLVTSGTTNTHVAEINFEPCAECGVAQASTSSSITLRTGASATDDLYNGEQIEIVRGTGAGQVRTITDYTGSSKIAAVDRAWQTNPSSTSVYKIGGIGQNFGNDIVGKVNVTQINAIAAAATALGFLYQGGVIQSSVNDASPTSSSFKGASGLSTTNDFYNQGILIFVSGTLAAQARQVSDYDGSTLLLTTGAFPSAPANGDKFVILGRVF